MYGHADIVPDRFTYNALLEAHTAAEDLEGVAKVFKAMIARGLQPDICTFVALFQVRALPRMSSHEHTASKCSKGNKQAM